jgi:hypothetical protein
MSRAAAGLLALSLLSCAAAIPDRTRPAPPPELGLTSAEVDVVLPGTRIRLHGKGFLPESQGSATIRFVNEALEVVAAGTYLDEHRLEVAMDEEAVGALGGDGAHFNGEVEVTYEYQSGAAPQAASLPIGFDLRTSLTPRLDGASPELVYLSSALVLRGEGFLSPSEGGTHAVLQGTFTADGGGGRSVQANAVTAYVSRTEAHLEVAPEIFGIRPGRFEGTLLLRNTPLIAAARDSGAPRALALTLGPTAVLEATPQVRRGQRLVVQGRGFIPKNAEAAQATLLRLEGDFIERRGGAVQHWRGNRALELIADFVSGSELRYVLRVFQTPSGELTGLGLLPGTFDGQVFPVLVRGEEEFVGTALAARIEIRPQRQVVFLKFLPGFTDTLRTFGLRNVELEIRERILAVCLRDYERWNLEFRETRPTDYVEYEVVEIGGPDPNNQGLFGLDNTTGKDLGNLRFNDVIGGYNAETEEEGYLAYGGIFLESFLGLSPKARDPIPIANPLFDQIFDPFRPDRGGTPVAPVEYPDDPRRRERIAEAIRVLGNLVGTTVTHEIGHTLGLAIAEGYFHNPVPGPNQLMDSGDERSFEERAELGGEGPAELEPEHVQYLNEILPKD